MNTLAPENYFIELDIAKQLERLLMNEDIVKDLERELPKFDGQLRDLTDGKVFQDYLRIIRKTIWDLSYTLNTDGCQPDDSSHFSAWPIYIMLHELSPKFRKKHLILAGLWFQKKEPDMNLLFQPFVEQAIKLHEEGFTWKRNGSVRTSYLHPLGCCVDTPARSAVLKMSSFHGYDGCTYCHQKGERINGVMKWLYKKPAADERTDQDIRDRMINPNPDPKKMMEFGTHPF